MWGMYVAILLFRADDCSPCSIVRALTVLLGFFFSFFLRVFDCFSLVKIPELQENMFQLATEMERAGLVEEVVADGLALTDVRSTTKAFVVRRIVVLSCALRDYF